MFTFYRISQEIILEHDTVKGIGILNLIHSSCKDGEFTQLTIEFIRSALIAKPHGGPAKMGIFKKCF